MKFWITALLSNSRSKHFIGKISLSEYLSYLFGDSREKRLGISCELSAKQTIHMKSQALFSLIFYATFLLHGALNVKHCRCVFQH